MTDKVTDMLIRIKNAYLARQKTITVPYFGFGERLAKLLTEKGYLAKVEALKSEKPKDKVLNIDLAYKDKKPAIDGIKIISKPSLKIYVGAKNIKRVMGGVGTSIISTPKGVMTGEEAKKKNLGGEIICEIW